jgi:hypothetical protein
MKGSSATAKAIDYSLGRREPLTRYLGEGAILIDNSRCWGTHALPVDCSSYDSASRHLSAHYEATGARKEPDRIHARILFSRGERSCFLTE